MANLIGGIIIFFATFFIVTLIGSILLIFGILDHIEEGLRRYGMDTRWTNKLKMSIMAKRLVAKNDCRGDFFLVDPHDHEEIFYDDFSDTFFKSTRQNVLGAELALNREFCTKGKAYLSTFYDLLMPNYPDEYKECVWNRHGSLLWIDIEHIFVSEPFLSVETDDEFHSPYHLLVFADLPQYSS